VTLSIAPGFHAYAPGEQIGKPVELKLKDGGAWSLAGPVEIPAGKEKDLGELGRSVILEGTVPLKATLGGGAEKAPVDGTVTVQVCTDKACDRPRTHAFQVPTT
jgi:hypothetical protein